MNVINKNRIKKELEMIGATPPVGISCTLSDDALDSFSAQIVGPPGTPYEGGIFHLDIRLPDRYPFDPPRVRFVTPIYHPNIDTSGRICLDTLKLPPKGTWRPCLNLSTVLMMIRVLMGEPGSEDPLMTDIWQEFKYDYTTYTEKAKRWTKQHAMGGVNAGGIAEATRSSQDDTSEEKPGLSIGSKVCDTDPKAFTMKSRENGQENEPVCDVKPQIQSDKRTGKRLSSLTDNSNKKLGRLFPS